MVDISKIIDSYDPVAAKVDAYEGNTKYIKKDERYSKETDWLDTALGALDYAGNVSRSAILGASRGGISGALDYAGQALSKDRFTSSTQIKKLAFGDLQFAPDDGVFQWGDVADFGLDLMFDIATDPLTYASFGFGKAMQLGGKFGGKATGVGIKGLSEGIKASDDLADIYKQARKGVQQIESKNVPKQIRDNIIENADAIAKFQLIENTARAGIGGVFGAGTIDDDDGFFTGAAKIAGGAALGGLGPQAMRKGRKAFNRASDDLSEGYAAATRGLDNSNQFKTIYNEKGEISRMGLGPAARIMSNEVAPKINRIVKAFTSGQADAMKGLSDVEKTQVYRMLEASKELVKKNRRENKILQKKKLKLQQNPNNPVREKDYFDTMAAIDQKTLDSLKAPGGLHEKFAEEYSKSAMEALEKMGDFNDALVKRLNDAGERNLQSMRYHIPTFRKLGAEEQIEKVDSIFQHLKGRREVDIKNPNMKIHSAMAEKGNELEEMIDILKQNATAKEKKVPGWEKAKEVEAFEAVYGNYFRNIAHQTLTENEKLAKNIMEEYQSLTPTNKLAEKWEWGLDKFDKLSDLMKSNMLYASMSWIKNNFYDNAMKSYVQVGLNGILDSATMDGALFKGINKDLDALINNKVVHNLDSETNKMLKLALDNGAIDAGMMASVMDKELVEYMTSAFSTAKKMKSDADWEKLLSYGVGEKYAPKAREGLEKVDAARKWWIDKLSGFTGRAGSYMEGASRFSTFKRTYKSLEGSGLADETRAKLAGEMVKKTFFNYGEVNHFERAFMKRIFPFYSFYSKNFPYWIDSMFDPTKAGRILNVEKARSNIGEDPDPELKKGLTDFLAHSAPRKLGQDEQGHKLAILPSMSIHDAIKMIPRGFTNVLDQVIEKSNPYFKAPLEIMTGKDFFTGDNLWVSETSKAERYLFSRGYKYYMAKKGLENLGLGEDGLVNIVPALGLNVRLDKKGNPKSLSDWNIVVDKALQLVLPTGGVDQILGAIGKTIFKKDQLDVILQKQFLPMYTTYMNPDYAKLRAAVVDRKARKKAEYLAKREKEQKEAKLRREREDK